MKTRVQHDLLGAVLQCHTKTLLEGEDLLQVPTQGGAVRIAQSEQIIVILLSMAAIKVNYN